MDQETGLILKSRDERVGLEFELHSVVLNSEIDERRFRPELGPDVTVVEPPTRPQALATLVKVGVRNVFRRDHRP